MSHSGPQGPSRRWGPGPEPSLPPITWRSISGRRPAIQTSSALAPAASTRIEWREVGPARKTLQHRGGLARLRGPSLGRPPLPSWGQLPAAHDTHLPLQCKGPGRQGHEDLPVPWTQESCGLPGPCRPSGSVSAGPAQPSVSRDETSSRSSWTAGEETAGNGRT